MSSARGFAVSWFNLFQLPDLVAKKRPLYDFMLATHHTFGVDTGAIATLHLLAL